MLLQWQNKTFYTSLLFDCMCGWHCILMGCYFVYFQRKFRKNYKLAFNHFKVMDGSF